MRRIGMTLAAVVWGGVLFTAAEAGACEGHHARADTAAAPVKGADTAREEPAAKKQEPGEQHAAKCQCGSAADCTCKKGTCECAKCKKPGHHDERPVEAEARATGAQPAHAVL